MTRPFHNSDQVTWITTLVSDLLAGQGSQGATWGDGGWVHPPKTVGVFKTFSTKVETHEKWGELCGIAVSLRGRLSTKQKSQNPLKLGDTQKISNHPKLGFFLRVQPKKKTRKKMGETDGSRLGCQRRGRRVVRDRLRFRSCSWSWRCYLCEQGWMKSHQICHPKKIHIWVFL